MSGWKRVRLDWLTTELRQTVSPEALGVDSVFHYSIPALDELGDGRVEDVSEVGSAKTLLQGGEVLISKLNPRKSRTLVAERHEQPTLCSGEFVVVRPERIGARFLVYLLLSETTRQELNGRVQSVTRSHQRVRPADVTKMWVRVPARAVQERIADFLDAETARIDALIEKKRRITSLLDERVAVIERLLTLGGEDERVPLRWHIRLTSGEGISPDSPPGPDAIPVVGGNGVMGFTVRQPLVVEPSIAVGRVGALCGNVHLVDPPAWISDNALWIREIRRFDRGYLAAALRASDLNSEAMQTAQPLITGETVKRLRVPCPAPAEQTEIVERLTQLNVWTAAVKERLHNQVTLLVEHRQALITAAVTGELDIAGGGMKANEKAFEDAIEASLLDHGGYGSGSPASFDAALGLDPVLVFAFLRETQEKSLGQLVSRYGGAGSDAESGFLKRLAAEIDDRGTLDVLRHGVVDQGVTLQLAYFKPAHGLTPELLSRYETNSLTLVRQLPYGQGTNTLDLCLFLNGIPLATAELKNPLTNQGVEHAKTQYRTDRDPANVLLGRRALVHFAVDPEEVAMTTKLEGQRTQFLPFNLGFEGGAGNPPNASGYRTSYLWERVWQRDAWLDLIARFIHVEMPSEGSKAERRAKARIIFPRFHQWDAVLKLETDARDRGAGQNYLVQHSAGSGKSNTIAWLAHRLSTLHDASDQKVFDKVVVITDRVILDRQLQETIYQFEHVHGVVEKIDKDSAQLAQALMGEKARVIITTLQKFPFVLDKVAELPQRRYAVIVDEAHSSQTGEAAKDLKLVLGEGEVEEADLAAAEVSDLAEEEQRGDGEDFLARQAAARGKQTNLSFFAYTATPKARTLELFGTRVRAKESAQDRFAPFHLYTMRQAIEEGFILDVLANYTTYDTYFKIEKAIEDDPEYEKAKARSAIARFLTLHPHNLAQKAEVIVEHFREHTAKKIGGKAKAMVVTSSRLHAVRYKLALDRYIHDKGYSDVHTLVAFSGTVFDAGDQFTEPSMNEFPESQTPRQFEEGDYQVLVVAEKFQTGYDQPLLHTMFVDKPLTGLHAVQTLSRLNRIHPQKNDTFVLDFRNNADDVQEAFKPYYDATIAIPSDPNLLYDTRRDLNAFNVLREDEVENAARLLASLGNERDHPKLYALLDPAVERFLALSEDQQDEFREALRRFVHVYAFLSQIVSFTDTSLERDYLYARALASLLPKSNEGRLDLGREVELTHLRLEQVFDGSISLDHGEGEVVTMFDGRGPMHEGEQEHLSQIIEVINERFGLKLTEADQLLFDQFEESWAADDRLSAQAKQNDLGNFRLAFDRSFMQTVVTRMDSNDEIFKRILDDADFRDLLADFYVRKVYERLRHAAYVEPDIASA